MRRRTKHKIRRGLTENASYKLVALFVTLVLWAAMLGRSTTVLEKEMDLQVLLNSQHSVVGDVQKKVKVKVSGPRVSLEKFSRNNETLTVERHAKVCK